MMKGPVELIEDSSQSNMNSDNSANEFSEYMWMGEELEEFDRQVEEQFWQEQFWETYLDELMEGENGDDKVELLQMMDMLSFQDHPQPSATAGPETSNASATSGLSNNHQHSTASASFSSNSTSSNARGSTLNPNAPEFIPRNVSPVNAADR
ncbi:uncharacterized protein LOC141899662 [Tubulanus polymorphus]|uniref:uncharacterized protein LOC141899662 n=1 Tax=Tubulanus polymorphus TaxID=672921 RepID=UPI003DA2DB90